MLLTAECTHVRSLSLLSFELGELSEEGSWSQQPALVWPAAPTTWRRRVSPCRPSPSVLRFVTPLSWDGAGWGQHSPGEGMPAAGSKHSAHANILIGSSLEGKLVQLQIQTVSKCV